MKLGLELHKMKVVLFITIRCNSGWHFLWWLHSW